MAGGSQNAFMDKLGPEFDLSWMCVVDFMHEFELGVWKGLFMHLIRILYAAAPGRRLVGFLDEQYAKITIICLWVPGLTNTGFATYLHLVQQYVDSPTMCLKWKSWQQEITKIYYRWAYFIICLSSYRLTAMHSVPSQPLRVFSTSVTCRLRVGCSYYSIALL